MTPAQMTSLITAVTQRVTDNQCAPVEVRIGYVSASGLCKDDGIVITDAPAVITEVVTDWAAAQRADNNPFVLVQAGHGGMFIS